MTSGAQSKGTDLDDIFPLYSSGTHPANTGYEVDGVDIANRYQPGATDIVTGYTMSNGKDIATVFGPSSAPATTQPNGVTYEGIISLAPSETTGGAQVICTASTSGWSISSEAEASGGAWEPTTPTTTPTGSALSGGLPSGATAVAFAVGANSGNTAGVVTNNAPAVTALTSGGITVTVTNQGPRATTNANYAVTVNWYNGSTWIGTGTINLDAQISAVG